MTAMNCAAMVIRCVQERKARRLTGMGPEEVIMALGVSRAQAYARAAEIGDEISSRGPGRPRKPQTETPRERCSGISLVVLDYVVANPGSAYLKKDRRVYSDDFKAFVLDLMAPGDMAHGMTAAQVARGLNIPVHTLNSWRGTGRRKLIKAAQKKPAPPSTLDDSTPVFSPEVQRLIKLFETWKGTFSGFCDALPGHGIHLSAEKVAQILDIADVRPRPRRKRVEVDAEMLRGKLERFFANAQLCEDGKNVSITLGDKKYTFAWQVMVDVATNAVVGFDVRTAESGEGFLNALDQATETAKEPPLATMRDRRKCNVSQDVEDALEKQGIESILTPKKRPQTNGPAENLFSLLTQTMPGINIDAENPQQLAKSLLEYILLAFVLGRNLVPRKRLNGKTPGDAFREREVDDEERRKAQEKLKKRARDSRTDRSKRGGSRKEDPVVKALLHTEFQELAIEDSKGKTAAFLAKLGMDVALEAIALYRARIEGGFEPNGSRAGYLTGIAVRLANRNEDMRQYHHHLRLRMKAGELLFEPFDNQLAALRQELEGKELVRSLVRRSHAASTKAERQFWWRAALTDFAALPVDKRRNTGDWMANRTANRRSIHLFEKDWMIAQVAKVASGYPM